MTKFRSVMSLLPLAFAFASIGGGAESQADHTRRASLILTGGPVYTLDSSQKDLSVAGGESPDRALQIHFGIAAGVRRNLGDPSRGLRRGPTRGFAGAADRDSTEP